MKRMPRLLLGGAALLLAACATTPLPPFPPSHPASPQAQEAPVVPLQSGLAPDDATKRSNDLLTAAEKGTPAPAPAPADDMPGMPMGGSHENH